MLRKFIKILICVLVTIFAFSTAGYASQDDISVLKALGIIRSYNEDGYKSDINLTRGEAAYMVCNMLDIKLDPSGYKIDNQHVNWSECAIDYMVSAGFLNEANAEKEILYNEYVTLLVRALGYKEYAEANGGYPGGYSYVASHLGFVAMSGNKTVTKGEAASMMLRAANSEIAKYDFTGNHSLSFNSGVTALEKHLSVYHHKGQVDANSITGLETPDGVGEGYIKIDGVAYAVSNEKYDDYLGNKVDFYYLDDDGEYTILWLKINDSRQDSVVVEAKYIEKYNNFVYTCFNGNKTVSIRISANSDVIYNGKLAQDFDESVYTPGDGMVEFIDTDLDRVYDVVKITDYTTVVVYNVDITKEVIYNRIGANVSFGTKVFSAYDDKGERIEINDLKMNDVLLFTAALDNSYSKCILVRNSIEGTICGIETLDNEQYITIDDTRYEVNKSFLNSVYYKPVNGQNGVFCLDGKNRIVWIDSEYASVKIGYLYKAFVEENDETVAGFRIIDNNGNFVNYYSNGKVIVNDTPYKNAQPVVSMFATPQIISYKLNADGNIVRIDTAVSDKNKLHMSVSGQNLYYKSSGKIFGMKMAVDNNTCIYVVPSDGSMDPNSYETLLLSDLINDVSYKKLEGYRIGNTHGALDALVIYGNKTKSTLNKHSNIAYVKDISVLYDANEETVKPYIELIGGKSGGFFVDEETDISGIEAGDIIIFNLDSESEIAVAERIYNNTNKIFSTTALKDGLKATKGYVYYSENGYITITTSLPQESDFDENNANIFVGSKFKIYMFDDGRNQNMYSASADELIPYNVAGNGCTEIIVFTLNEDAKYIFEIQK